MRKFLMLMPILAFSACGKPSADRKYVDIQVGVSGGHASKGNESSKNFETLQEPLSIAGVNCVGVLLSDEGNLSSPGRFPCFRPDGSTFPVDYMGGLVPFNGAGGAGSTGATVTVPMVPTAEPLKATLIGFRGGFCPGLSPNFSPSDFGLSMAYILGSVPLNINATQGAAVNLNATFNPSNIISTCHNPTGLSDNYKQAVMASGPKAYYRLEGAGSAPVGTSLIDETMSALNLSVFMTTESFTASGRIGGGFQFSGTTGGAQVTNGNGATAVDLTGDFTVDLWVYPLALGASQIISKYAGGKGWNIDIAASYPRFNVSDGTVTATSTAGSVLTASTWFHLAGVFVASTKTAYIYVNGVQQTGGAQGGMVIANVASTGALSFGTDGTGAGTNTYTGIIDEPAVYLKQLTAGEILNHYNKGF